MDPEACSFLRCGKHPSQAFTGFCAHCLVERLSTVDPGERKATSYTGGGPAVDGIAQGQDRVSASSNAPEKELIDVDKEANGSSALPAIASESRNVKVRQTLWSLFYSNNEGGSGDNVTRRVAEKGSLIGQKDGALVGIDSHDHSSVGFGPNPNGHCTGNQLKSGFSSKTSNKNFSSRTEKPENFCDFGNNSEAQSSSADKTSTDTQSGGTGNDGERVYFVSESRVPKSVANKYTQVETNIDVSASDVDPESRFSNCMKDQILKRRTPVMLGLGLAKKVLRWRIKCSQKKISKAEADLVVGFDDWQLQDVVDNGPSCCRRESTDSNDTCSWDRLLIGKAFARSLSVKEEGNDAGSTKPVEEFKEMQCHPGSLESVDSFSDSAPHIRRMTKKVGSVDFEWSTDMKDMNKIIPAVVDDDKKLASDIAYAGDSCREKFCGSLLEDWSCRGKFHGCSKIWSRVIASPFWGFVQKSENVLDRSLSECWHESRREKNRETAELFNRVRLHRNSSVSSRSIDKSQEHHDMSSSNLSTTNADFYGFHSVWNKKKSYGMLGHSRSIHYSSPSNLDNGLLRFYLTPMRYNRRLTSRNRGRNTRYFW